MQTHTCPLMNTSPVTSFGFFLPHNTSRSDVFPPIGGKGLLKWRLAYTLIAPDCPELEPPPENIFFENGGLQFGRKTRTTKNCQEQAYAWHLQGKQQGTGTRSCHPYHPQPLVMWNHPIVDKDRQTNISTMQTCIHTDLLRTKCTPP